MENIEKTIEAVTEAVKNTGAVSEVKFAKMEDSIAKMAEALEAKAAAELEAAKNASILEAKSEGEEEKEEKVIEEYKKELRRGLESQKAASMDMEKVEAGVRLLVKKSGSQITSDVVEKEVSRIITDVKRGFLPVLDIKTMREGVDPDGGYLGRKPEFGGISDRSFDMLAFRSLAQVYRINSESMDFILDDGKPNAYWKGEEGAWGNTNQPQLGEVSIKTGEIYANPKVTLKMIEDGMVDVVSWLNVKSDEAFELKEEEAFMVGTGENDRPHGLFSYDSWANSEVYERDAFRTYSVASAEELENAIIRAYLRLPNRAKRNASWVMNPLTWIVVCQLANGIGEKVLNKQLVVNGAEQTLMGRPVFTSEYAPVMFDADGAIQTGIKGIFVGDLKKVYAVIDRNVKARLVNPYAEQGYVRLESRARIGGGCINFSDGIYISAN